MVSGGIVKIAIDYDDIGQPRTAKNLPEILLRQRAFSKNTAFAIFDPRV